MKLALSEQKVCVIAHEKLLTKGKGKIVKVPVSDKPDDFGPQDYILCTLKSHQSYMYADTLAYSPGDETAIVTAMNGIPTHTTRER